MGCHSDYYGNRCPVQNWCVCQWAFASYVSRAGGCEHIQDIVCEATNLKALEAYEANRGRSDSIDKAYECIKSRCAGAISMGVNHADQVTTSSQGNAGEPKVQKASFTVTTPIMVSVFTLCVVVGVGGGFVLGRRSRRIRATLSAADGNKEML